MKNSEAVEKHLKAGKVPYVSGRNWTTDAIYRETPDNIARHRKDGCISVEMEAAGGGRLYGSRALYFLFRRRYFGRKLGYWKYGRRKGKRTATRAF